MKTVKYVQQLIEEAGGMANFSSTERRDRPVGCPMKNALSLNHGWSCEEADKLGKDELHVGFLIGAIENNSSN